MRDKLDQKVIDAAEVAAIGRHIENMEAPLIVIPKGMDGVDEIRANIARFLRKQGSTVEHLIMIIHPENFDLKG